MNKSIQKFFNEFGILYKSSRVKNSLVYLSGSIIGTGVGFFLVPILTRYLTPSDYGIVANYTAVLALVSYFICLSNSGYLFRNFFFLDKEQFSKSTSNVFFINSVIAIFIFFLLLLLNRIIFNELQIPLQWLLFIPFLAFAQIFIDTTLGLYQAKNSAKKYSLLQLAQTVFNLGFSILFVVVFFWNWQGRIAAQLITASDLALFGITLLIK